MLIESRRLVTIGLEKMGRGRRLVCLRGRHVVDVARVQGRLVEQGGVELVASAARRREKREIAVVKVRRQVRRLRRGVERQRGVGAGWRRRLAKRIVRVEDGGVGEAAVSRKGLLLLLLLLLRLRLRLAIA